MINWFQYFIIRLLHCLNIKRAAFNQGCCTVSRSEFFQLWSNCLEPLFWRFSCRRLNCFASCTLWMETTNQVSKWMQIISFALRVLFLLEKWISDQTWLSKLWKKLNFFFKFEFLKEINRIHNNNKQRMIKYGNK